MDKTGDVRHYPGSGILRTLRVPHNISAIKDLILSQNNVFITRKVTMIN